MTTPTLTPALLHRLQHSLTEQGIGLIFWRTDAQDYRVDYEGGDAYGEGDSIAEALADFIQRYTGTQNDRLAPGPDALEQQLHDLEQQHPSTSPPSGTSVGQYHDHIMHRLLAASPLTPAEIRTVRLGLDRLETTDSTHPSGPGPSRSLARESR